MGTITAVIVAAVAGLALAAATTVTVVQVAKQTPSNTKQVEQPLIVYGAR
jgi:hypothetical protein